MQAAVCHTFNAPLEIRDITIAPPGPGEIAVDIRACAICHSDISFANGIWGGALPAVYGHEAAGVVASVGSGVTAFQPGDRVLVTLIRACGSCPACAGGHPTSCDHAWDATPSPLSLDGKKVEHGLKTAAFAERAVVDQSQIIHLPDDIAFDVASLLACGVITGVGAATNTAKVRPGSSVVVIGAGGVGLNTIQGAAIMGAGRIIALDVSRDKCDGALEFGATDALLATGPEVASEIRALTGNRGADYVFVTVGAPQVFNTAPSYLAAGGEMIMVGMPATGVMAEYEPASIAAMNQSLKGSRMGQTVLPRDIPWLIEMYRQGRLKLDELITGRYALSEINEAFEDTRKGLSRRNVIIF